MPAPEPRTPLLTMRTGGLRVFDACFGLLALADVAIGLVLPVARPAVLIGLGALLLVWAIVPRRLELYADRLRIVLPLRLHWDIGYDSIVEAREAAWWEPYAFMGVRLATAPSQAVVLLRGRANPLRQPNLVISPAQRAVFLPALRQALASYRDARPLA